MNHVTLHKNMFQRKEVMHTNIHSPLLANFALESQLPPVWDKQYLGSESLSAQHNEIGSWVAFSCHAPRPRSATMGSVPIPPSDQWNVWKMPVFWLWHCHEFLFIRLHWAVTMAWRKSKSCPTVGWGPGAGCFCKKLENPPCCCVCVHDQVYICVGQKITLDHTQAPYILWIFSFFFLLFSREVLLRWCGGECL